MALSEDEEFELLSLERERTGGLPVPEAPTRSRGEQLGRTVGLGARSLVEGALSVPATILGGLEGIYNVAADKLEGKGVSDLVAEKRGFRFSDPQQDVQRFLTNVGFPEPETTSEKVLNLGGSMMGGAAAAPVERLVKQAPKTVMTVKDLATQSAKDAGYKMPPSATGPSATGRGGITARILESIAGKAATKQEAGLGNQTLTNELARKAAGLQTGEEITKTALASARETMKGPYRQIAKLSPIAAKALDKLEDSREEMKLAFNEYNRTASRQALKDARAAQAQVGTLEKLLEREASKAGVPGLYESLKAARTALAKNHDIERALNTATGDVSARVLGRMLDKKPMTGEGRTIASFARAFPQYAGDAASIPAPGVSKLGAYAAPFMGMAGSVAVGHPAGAAAAALPLLSGPARKLVLSGLLERRPDLAPAVIPSLVLSDRLARAVLGEDADTPD